MTDYISREAAIKMLRGEAIAKYPMRYFANGLLAASEELEKLPAADVREVVLCRDCRYYRQSNFVDKHMECARSGFPVHPVDFCSLADMREEQT